MGDVDRLPPLGALPFNRTPLPHPTSNDLLSLWPPKYCLLSLGNVWKEPFFSMVAKPRQRPGCAGQSPPRTL